MLPAVWLGMAWLGGHIPADFSFRSAFAAAVVGRRWRRRHQARLQLQSSHAASSAITEGVCSPSRRMSLAALSPKPAGDARPRTTAQPSAPRDLQVHAVCTSIASLCAAAAALPGCRRCCRRPCCRRVGEGTHLAVAGLPGCHARALRPRLR
eukprot:366367-Chlamydomonas_euryale.AAC.10